MDGMYANKRSDFRTKKGCKNVPGNTGNDFGLLLFRAGLRNERKFLAFSFQSLQSLTEPKAEVIGETEAKSSKVC